MKARNAASHAGQALLGMYLLTASGLCAAAATFTSLRLRTNLPAEQQNAGMVEESAVLH